MAPGVKYDENNIAAWRENFRPTGAHMELTGLRDSIEFEKHYTVDDFTADYNSYKGTALGLAHTFTISLMEA